MVFQTAANPDHLQETLSLWEVRCMRRKEETKHVSESETLSAFFRVHKNQGECNPLERESLFESIWMQLFYFSSIQLSLPRYRFDTFAIGSILFMVQSFSPSSAVLSLFQIYTLLGYKKASRVFASFQDWKYHHFSEAVHHHAWVCILSASSSSSLSVALLRWQDKGLRNLCFSPFQIFWI